MSYLRRRFFWIAAALAGGLLMNAANVQAEYKVERVVGGLNQPI